MHACARARGRPLGRRRAGGAPGEHNRAVQRRAAVRRIWPWPNGTPGRVARACACAGRQARLVLSGRERERGRGLREGRAGLGIRQGGAAFHRRASRRGVARRRGRAEGRGLGQAWAWRGPCHWTRPEGVEGGRALFFPGGCTCARGGQQASKAASAACSAATAHRAATGTPSARPLARGRQVAK